MKTSITLHKTAQKKKSQDTLFSQETVLFETDYDHPAKLRNLVSESRNVAALDIGATNAATGTSWMNTYIDSLEKAEKAKVRCLDKVRIFTASGMTTQYQPSKMFSSSFLIKE